MAIEADATRHLAEQLDTWRNKYPGVPVSQEVVRGHTGRVLAGLSARADLVVIGRHAKAPCARSRFVRHALLNHALSPVAIIPSP